MFRAYFEGEARRHVARQLGKPEAEVTDDDIAKANEDYRREAFRRTKWNFGIGCGGIILLMIFWVIYYWPTP